MVKWLLKIVLLSSTLLISSCVQLTLAWTNLKPSGAVATPPILATFEGSGDIKTLEEWQGERAPALRAALEAHVYGVMPEASSAEILNRKVLDDNAFDGLGVLEEIAMKASATFGGVTNETRVFLVNVVYPKAATGPSPMILMESFCPRWDTLRHPNITRPQGAGSCLEGTFAPVFGFIFGRYNATPPIEDILKAGYGFAGVYTGEFIPDNAAAGFAALRDLSKGHLDDDTRWGTIAAWGWAYSRIADVLAGDARVDAENFIAYGHSRYGKSALIAGAYDERFSAVVSHQSGTGGASLNRRKKGESVKQITDSYPHWFARNYAGYAGREEEMPVDQHHLLALIAPRPILLGNARRDVWSDPNGAFRAAMGASPVYELYGRKGLTQERLNIWQPEAGIAFWIRPGTHGTVEEDWPAFLEFLQAHVQKR